MTRLLLLLISLCCSTMLSAQVIEVDTEEQYQNGLVYLQANQFQKAIDAFYECYRNDFNNVDLAAKLGYCYNRLGNLKEARFFYEAILKRDSLHTSAISNLAAIAERELNYQQAKTYYNRLLVIDSTNSYYYRQSAFVRKRMGEILPAIEQFNKAHLLNPADITIVDELAQLYLKLEALPYAETFADKGIVLDSNNIRILYTNARVKSELDKHEEVVKYITKAMAKGDSTTYYQKILSVSYLQLDSLEAAIFHLKRIIDKKQDSEHTHHYLGLAYQKLGEIELSVTHLEKAIEKGISKRLSLYHRDLAALHEEQQQHKEAIDHYQAAYDQSKKAVYLFYLARNHDLYYKDKRMAIRYYRKYLASNHPKYKEYAESRVAQLQEIVHFQKR